VKRFRGEIGSRYTAQAFKERALTYEFLSLPYCYHHTSEKRGSLSVNRNRARKWIDARADHRSRDELNSNAARDRTRGFLPAS
jgi:hypothetical protein